MNLVSLCYLAGREKIEINVRKECCVLIYDSLCVVPSPHTLFRVNICRHVPVLFKREKKSSQWCNSYYDRPHTVISCIRELHSSCAYENIEVIKSKLHSIKEGFYVHLLSFQCIKVYSLKINILLPYLWPEIYVWHQNSMELGTQILLQWNEYGIGDNPWTQTHGLIACLE